LQEMDKECKGYFSMAGARVLHGKDGACMGGSGTGISVATETRSDQ
jgi:hypothetical protein